MITKVVRNIKGLSHADKGISDMNKKCIEPIGNVSYSLNMIAHVPLPIYGEFHSIMVYYDNMHTISI